MAASASILGFVSTQIVNRSRIPATSLDYATGDYTAQKSFIKTLGEYQTSMLTTGTVTLKSGQEVSVDSIGGATALQFLLQDAETTRDAQSGAAKAGLKNNDNKLWTLQ